MVNFLRSNPASDRLRENQRNSQITRLRDVQLRTAESELDRGERLRRQREATDRAMRKSVGDYLADPMQRRPAAAMTPAAGGQVTAGTPQPGRSGPVDTTQPIPQVSAAPRPAGGFRGRPGLRTVIARNLAGVEGGGEAAAQMALTDIDREMQVMEKTFELAASNPDMAAAFAEQNGVPVSPKMQTMIRNKQIAGWFKNLISQSKAIYPGAINARKRWEFFKQQIKGLDEGLKAQGGLPQQVQTGVPAGMEGSPAPDVAPAKQQMPYQFLTGRGDEGEPTIVRGNKATGEVETTGVAGYGTGGRGAGQDPARVREAQWLVDNGIYPDLASAYKATRMRVSMDPATIRANAFKWMTSQTNRYGDPLFPTPEKQKAAFLAYQKFVAGDVDGAVIDLKALAPPPKTEEPGWIKRTIRRLFDSTETPATPVTPATPRPPPQQQAPSTGGNYTFGADLAPAPEVRNEPAAPSSAPQSRFTFGGDLEPLPEAPRPAPVTGYAQPRGNLRLEDGFPPAPPQPQTATPQQRIAQARDAIARGADPAAVRARLRAIGIDPTLLDQPEMRSKR